MKLEAAIRAYVQVKRDLGHLFIGDDRMLRSFARSTGDLELQEITPEICEAFYRSKRPDDRMPNRKHQCLRCFFEFAKYRGYLEQIPLKAIAPRPKSRFEPYIYSKEEIRKILDAAAGACLPGGFVTPKVLRCLLLTVYVLGLRSGEALRLRRRDLDLKAQLLTVWDTKFFKSRIIPVGSALMSVLKSYIRGSKATSGTSDDEPLFPSRVGSFISAELVQEAFRRACKEVGVTKPGDGLLDVRIHDLRHSFAVHRLVQWYREGANVQVLLPRLSTYMGHLDLRSTQLYLTMTHELLGEASRRFEGYAMSEGNENDHRKAPNRAVPAPLPGPGNALGPQPQPKYPSQLPGHLRPAPSFYGGAPGHYPRAALGRGRQRGDRP